MSDTGHVRCLTLSLAAALALLALAGCGGGSRSSDWPLPNADLSSTRAVAASGITAANVHALHVAWRFRLPTPIVPDGVLTATPVVSHGVVYLQDMKSDVYALDLATGAVRWKHLFDATNPGPDGLAVTGDRIYGATDSLAFELSAKTGRLLWQHFLVSSYTQRYVDIAPQVADGVVYVSTIGSPPNGRGTLYGLDAQTGHELWRFDTIKGRWHVPSLAGGGGAWWAPSVGGGQVFWGTANPLPWGGSKRYPNGGVFAGPALYTDSLVVTDAKTGHVDWYDQVTPHDVRDYDFALPPILVKGTVISGGKGGTVVAWDRKTHRRLWATKVGVHRNDSGPLPTHMVSVCPGLYGGILTPMAYADGRVFAPVVDLCMRGSAYGYEPLENVDVTHRARGELVALDAATGRRDWTVPLPQADFSCATVARGVVFTATFDGTVYGFDAKTGARLWIAHTPSRINSCPSVAGDTLLVGAGVPTKGAARELVAYRPTR
ncbi:MAG: PQQ-binding-like beta-propeller repeat protein [Actinobacteria bacterium]|nr:PQQ-binding-like beta-propeller repeat protein [Actinomycetota bacterium]